MRWRRLGRVFHAEGQRPWMHSHASNPVAEPLGGDHFRVYFGTRDGNNRTRIGSVVVEVSDRVRVLDIDREPVVGPGERGEFDDAGTSLGCVVSDKEKTCLYYVGWHLAADVPWRNTVGLAVRNGRDGAFVKVGQVVGCCSVDSLTLTYPWVLPEAGGWRMWYGSNLTWGPADFNEMTHAIRSASSTDGRSWRKEGDIVLAPRGPQEIIVIRPCIARVDGVYRMWFCRRDRAAAGKPGAYRLGYAESADGLRWERRDEEAGMEPSGDGWDGDEVAYPSVFTHRGALHLLYNGNGFGRSGFGIARAR